MNLSEYGELKKKQEYKIFYLRLIIDDFTNLERNSTERFEELLNQNKHVEEFLVEIVKVIKEKQEKSAEFFEKVLATESEFSIFKKEIKENYDDLENRYQYFQENVQKDVELILKSQNESTTGLEAFAKVIDQRSNIIEKNLESKIVDIEKAIKVLLEQQENSDNSGKTSKLLKDELTKLQTKLVSIEKENNMNFKDFAAVKGQLDNFRNEITAILVDNENDVSKKLSELKSGMGSLSRQLGVRNPLI